MAPELNKKNLQAVQTAIGNMMMNEAIRPKGTESMFEKLSKNSEQAAGVENAIGETKRSMNQLMDQRSKLIGSIDTLYDLIADQITDEDVAKHGAKPIQQPTAPEQGQGQNELPDDKTS